MRRPDLMDAARRARLLMQQSPLQSLLAAMTISFALGAIPMMLAVTCSIMRSVSDWYRTFHPMELL